MGPKHSPGQGAQSVGMLGDLAAEHPSIESRFAEASEVLGFDLWAMTQEGPAEQLGQTENTQPALLVASVALWDLWPNAQEKVSVMSGHSHGECQTAGAGPWSLASARASQGQPTPATDIAS